MNSYLLDTNVVSELSKQRPHPDVMNFLLSPNNMWLSSIVVYELELGIQLLPEGQRQDRLRIWLTRIVEDFRGRILPIRRPEAEAAASFQAHVQRGGRRMELADALIAGTAEVRGLTLATRNIRDFRGLDIDIVNPWEVP
ncbi:MAG: type II toxin-antitoxin system VapC family toxin [Dehalococcoidia bacterium]|nr:type II toxin-antitoxin system VapC family toxin [Dehalococcoidia bacterium]